MNLKRIFSFFSLCLFLLPVFAGCSTSWSPFKEDKRPNFLIIVTDDQRYDTMQYMPLTQKLIFDQGVTFSHGFITTPLCCPSRSTILTGEYAHNHGVKENEGELLKETIIPTLKASGYSTALVGKYLNSWNGDARPEFDYWVSFQFGETRYNNPRLNVNGKWSRHEGAYITDTLGDYAVEYLKSASRKRSPFVLLLTFNAPHDPAVPADVDKYLPLDLPPRLPSFNEADVSDKPAWLDFKEPPLTDDAIKEIDAFRRGQILTLYSLDRNIEKVMNTLRDTGELDNTLVLFISDNGRHWGEHRLVAKNTVYDESIRVPFAIRFPSLIPQPYTDEHVVANVDIAPTLLDLAGLPIPPEMDGYSLVGLLNKTNTQWREGVLIEGWPPRGTYIAIRTEQYLYAETTNDAFAPSSDPQLELYDMEKDPYQMDSVAKDPAYQDILKHLQSLLQQELKRTHRSQ